MFGRKEPEKASLLFLKGQYGLDFRFLFVYCEGALPAPHPYDIEKFYVYNQASEGDLSVFERSYTRQRLRTKHR